jgi:hypothetical protein
MPDLAEIDTLSWPMVPKPNGARFSRIGEYPVDLHAKIMILARSRQTEGRLSL